MIYNDDPVKRNQKGEQGQNPDKNSKPDSPKKETDEDKFSPGEPDDYNAEEFSTD